LTLAIHAFVDVEGTIIFSIAGRAFAYVTVGLIKTVAVILAICIEAELTADVVVVRSVVVAL